MHWKFLRAGALGPFTGFEWVPGRWVTTEAVAACATGIHACRGADLPYWLADELWGIELAGPVVDGDHKVLARRARLLDRVEAWSEGTTRRLAEACVARAAGHAAAELRVAGYAAEAGRLEGRRLDELAEVAREVMESLAGRRGARRATKVCGYVLDAVEATGAYPVATVAYMAARAANQRSGPAELDLYAAERAWQAQWLVRTLRLDAAG